MSTNQTGHFGCCFVMFSCFFRPENLAKQAEKQEQFPVLHNPVPALFSS